MKIEEISAVSPKQDIEKYITATSSLSGDSLSRQRVSASEQLLDRLAHVGRALHDLHAGRGQRRHLFGRRALAAGDDRAGVAHAASGRRRLAGDEADDRLLEVAP